MERGGFGLRNLRRFTEHLGGAGLIKTHLPSGAAAVVAHRLQQPQSAKTDYIRGVFRLIERDPHVRLRGQVVDLVGRHQLDNSPQTGAVTEVAVVEL